MSTASFSSLANADILEIELIPLTGEIQRVRLLVDSGFTGTSSLVLPSEFAEFIRADLPEAETSGALHGFQKRGWVSCQVVGMRSRQTVIAIFTDVSVLSLPDNVVGMVGLTFLRQFTQWGAALSATGWQFSLTEQLNS
jgi:predicted aspartyl protease